MCVCVCVCVPNLIYLSEGCKDMQSGIHVPPIKCTDVVSTQSSELGGYGWLTFHSSKAVDGENDGGINEHEDVSITDPQPLHVVHAAWERSYHHHTDFQIFCYTLYFLQKLPIRLLSLMKL